MAITRNYKIGDELPPLTKHMTQDAINAFEKSGGATGPSPVRPQPGKEALRRSRAALGPGKVAPQRVVAQIGQVPEAEVLHRRPAQHWQRRVHDEQAHEAV